MVGSSSVGAVVPSVKSEQIMLTGGSNSRAVTEGGGADAPPPSGPSAQAQRDLLVMPKVEEGVETDMIEMDKDFLCPICMQIIKDAFLTSCGHSFCYMCVVTHLENKSDCPCCGHYLTTSHLHPNFLLNKV